jgi:hypothetical protein
MVVLNGMHKLPSKSSEEKLFQVPAAFYLGYIELVIIGLMGTFYESLILFLSLGDMNEFRVKRKEERAV